MNWNKDMFHIFILLVELLHIAKVNSENVSSFSFFEVVAGQV